MFSICLCCICVWEIYNVSIYMYVYVWYICSQYRVTMLTLKAHLNDSIKHTPKH